MIKKEYLRGIMPALCTITKPDGELDEEDERALVRFCIECDVHGLAISLIGGEFYKFTEEERKRLYKIVIDEVNGKVPVFVGTSHSGTDVVIKLSKYAQDIGADGIIVLPPYFNKIEASLCLRQHFEAIMDSVSIPVMIQDSEDETGVYMTPTLYCELAEKFDNFWAVKVEGCKSIDKIQEIKRVLGDRLIIFGGMGGKMLLEEMALGAKGNIPGPSICDFLVRVYEAYHNGNIDKARGLFSKLKPFFDFGSRYGAAWIEIEKEALLLRGVIKLVHSRGPRIALSEEGKKELRVVFEGLELLKE
jgi:4-hydroxy-tetrahydrodipicolinate synthase